MNWIPDTCDLGKKGCCVSQVIVDGKVAFGGQVINKCLHHANVPDNILYDVLVKENREKNFTERYLIELPDIAEVDIDNNRKYKAGVSFSWAWIGTDDKRELVPIIKGAAVDSLVLDNIKMQVTDQIIKVV